MSVYDLYKGNRVKVMYEDGDKEKIIRGIFRSEDDFLIAIELLDGNILSIGKKTISKIIQINEGEFENDKGVERGY